MHISARVALFSLGLSGLVGFGSPQARAADGPGVDAKTAFAKLKTLSGEWKSESDEKHGHGPAGEKVVYSVTANGTTVMQKQFPGSDHEMVSMYHLDGDDLKMTHYCAIGNQPRLKLDRKASTADALVFDFDGGTNFDPAKDMHIHALTIHFKPGGKVEEAWQAWAGGKKAMESVFKLSKP